MSVKKRIGYASGGFGVFRFRAGRLWSRVLARRKWLRLTEGEEVPTGYGVLVEYDDDGRYVRTCYSSNFVWQLGERCRYPLVKIKPARGRSEAKRLAAKLSARLRNPVTAHIALPL